MPSECGGSAAAWPKRWRYCSSPNGSIRSPPRSSATPFGRTARRLARAGTPCRLCRRICAAQLVMVAGSWPPSAVWRAFTSWCSPSRSSTTSIAAASSFDAFSSACPGQKLDVRKPDGRLGPRPERLNLPPRRPRSPWGTRTSPGDGPMRRQCHRAKRLEVNPPPMTIHSSGRFWSGANRAWPAAGSTDCGWPVGLRSGGHEPGNSYFDEASMKVSLPPRTSCPRH